MLGEVEEIKVLEAVGVGGGDSAGAGGGEFAGELREVFGRGCGGTGEYVDGGVVDKVVGTEAGGVDAAGDEIEAAEGVEELCGECWAIYSRQQGQYLFLYTLQGQGLLSGPHSSGDSMTLDVSSCRIMVVVNNTVLSICHATGMVAFRLSASTRFCSSANGMLDKRFSFHCECIVCENLRRSSSNACTASGS